ncbi:MAG: lysine--tRNA ligase [Candidatus Pacebacteria bacterium]|nr:lysine--tRNA ligase [Candidatus Paceibacterota bacterium]MBP9772845.1 lysine--tRNA ligase [Candidatus Paceibacterota bacterium]
MAALDEIRESRLQKLARLREAGMDPYPARISRDLSLKDLRENFDSKQSASEKVTVAGRIMAIRGQGAILFVVLDDGTDKFQCVFKKDTIDEKLFTLFTEAIDIGDFISVSGTLFTTERGEKSILTESWNIVTKSLLPLPEKWHGITDEDERYRKRYLDMLMNPELREIFKKRSKFWNVMREYLLSKDFIEVETPVLENTTGGADARPFITHHNALDIDVYLRISAGELWQKKLLVAGFPRTFEIGRIFRNEGMSAEHLQDYTQLEYYMAYSDFNQGMEMTKELYRLIGEKVFGTTKFTIKGFEIDLAGDWQIYDFVEIIKKEYGIDALDTNALEIEDTLKKYEIKYEANDVSVERGVDLLWKRVRKTIGGPGFLINVPVYLEPLAKKNPENQKTVERFQVILAGSEMGKGFSELNDPVDQKERFMSQQALRDAGDDEAQMADMEFVEALEHGMPPAFGFGLSERLFSFLIDKPVRETVLFPLMKPRE